MRCIRLTFLISAILAVVACESMEGPQPVPVPSDAGSTPVGVQDHAAVPSGTNAAHSATPPTLLPPPDNTAPLLPMGVWKMVGCSLVWQEPAGGGPTTQQCHHEWQWREAHILSECRADEEKSGLLCYPPCRKGYSGTGPVCWQQCPSNYHDDGAFCRRDVRIISSNNDACPWYDKCGLTFARGCSQCPAGYHNDGCTCRIDTDIFAKQSYWRGAGSSMRCSKGLEQIGLLCYASCPPGFNADGVGCVAAKETCVDVPTTPPASQLKPFCFTLNNPQSTVTKCIPTKVFADTDANGKALAQCQCTNCEVVPASCENFDHGLLCK